jgi:thiamine pyrophosphate-dependent acetolactate synthase large subunit-like protein
MISNEPRLDQRLDRRGAIRILLENRGDLLLVTGLGSTTWDAASVADDEHNFYLWGAMGAAAMVGLGLAIAQPDRRVLVVTGDGEMLMGLGALATIACSARRTWRLPSSTTVITAKPACRRAIPQRVFRWSRSPGPAA